MIKATKAFTAAFLSVLIALVSVAPLTAFTALAAGTSAYENNAALGENHWNEPFSADRAYGVRSFADLASEYGAYEDYAHPWIYCALEFYEPLKQGESADFTDREGGQWKLTDHRVQAGEKLLMVQYVKSNIGISGYITDIQFDRTFFDIVPDSYKSGLSYDYSKDWYRKLSGSAGYIGETAADGKYGDGLYNTGYPSNIISGSEDWKTGNVSATHPATADDKAAMNVYEFPLPAFMAQVPYNHEVASFTPAPAAETTFRWDVFRQAVMDPSINIGIPAFNADEYVNYETVKVRTHSEPYRGDISNTVDYVPDGTAGHVGFEESISKLADNRYRNTFNIAAIGDPNTAGVSFNKGVVAGQGVNSKDIPAMTYANLHTEDMNHVFIIDESGAVSYTAKFVDSDGVTSIAASKAGTDITLPDAPSKSGYVFNGWNDGSSVYPAGAQYTLTSDVTFRAEWKTPSAHQHPEAEKAINYIAPTCTQSGKEADIYCEICDNENNPDYPDGIISKGNVTDPLGHDFGTYVYNNDATTEHDGTETATCSRCGEKDTRTKPGTKLDPDNPGGHTHVFSETVITPATCTGEGSMLRECSCGYSETVAVPALGHNFGPYIYNNDATTEQDGTETATCVRCGEKDTKIKYGSRLTESINLHIRGNTGSASLRYGNTLVLTAASDSYYCVYHWSVTGSGVSYVVEGSRNETCRITADGKGTATVTLTADGTRESAVETINASSNIFLRIIALIRKLFRMDMVTYQ